MTPIHSTHRSSIGYDFMTYGLDAVHVHRATELRAGRHQLTNPRGTTQLSAGLRHRLGGMMISLGSWLAGATTPTSAPVPERTLAPGR
ncbi:MAG TPA: hypothetical protein VNZ58_11275 [Thermomicrobiales bacterium]|nr:hypothetical protein [Thermomicrobiales bacterium]